jgi:tRNA pseudouridine55 synthase
MGRRKSGRNISGWLIVDKPAGLTSTTVVNKVRWALNANKAGHAGTLDPDATGVLAIALGEATKTVPYITDALKAYTFTDQHRRRRRRGYCRKRRAPDG